MTDGQVSAASESKLRNAMARLLNGRAQRTDGRLTKDNLWKEASVSRATMNRAATLIAEWDRAVGGTPQPRNAQIEALRTDLAEARKTIGALRQRLRDAEQNVRAAVTANTELFVENQFLRGQDPTRNIAHINRSPGR